MSRLPSQTSRTSWLLQSLVPLLNSDLIALLGALWRLGRRILKARAHEGMYEVLEYTSRLELQDTKGERAIFYKRERVRFLQDNIIAFQDQASGEGEIFADYKCSPGEAVDRYREGHRYRILISLRETKKRGDIEEFHIERSIGGGFTRDDEYFQTEVDHPTKKLSVSVVFPKRRRPKQITLVEQNSTRTIHLGPQHTRTLPDGRQQVTWSTDKPRLFEAYILRWSW